MPALEIARGVGGEARDAGAGHLEVDDLALDGVHDGRRVELDRRRREVAVEEVVQVLVGGDAHHHVVAGAVTEQPPGVAVGDAGGQLLQGDVDDAVDGSAGSGTSPVETWHMRLRSRATGSTARVTIR